MIEINIFVPSMTINKGTFAFISSLLILLSIATLAPTLYSPVWQDEAYSILEFQTKPFLFSFQNYPIPNNHPLLNAAASLIWDIEDSIYRTRLSLLAVFMFSLVSFCFVTSKVFGKKVAIIALLIFCSSNIGFSFATQIRGYGFSWIFVVLLTGVTAQFSSSGKVYLGIAYLVLSCALVATIPSNLIVSSTFVVWGLLTMQLNKELIVKNYGRILTLGLGPVVGILAYYEIWQMVLSSAQKSWSPWNNIDLVKHWGYTFIVDFPWLGLIIVLALVSNRFWDLRRLAKVLVVSKNFRFALAVFVPIIGSLLVLTNTPFPRSFVPYLPLFAIVLGIVVVNIIDRFESSFKVLSSSALALVCLLFFFYARVWSPCSYDPNVKTNEQNLCKQFYLGAYDPEKLLQQLNVLNETEKSLVITGWEATLAFNFLVQNNEIKNEMPMIGFYSWSKYLEYSQKNGVTLPNKILLVSDKLSNYKKIVSSLGINPKKMTELSSFGFFTVYEYDTTE
jgi:hypothetical protein